MGNKYGFLTVILIILSSFASTSADRNNEKYGKGPKRFQDGSPKYSPSSSTRAPRFYDDRRENTWRSKQRSSPETCGLTAKVAGAAGDALASINKAVPGLMPKGTAADAIKILNDFKRGKTEKATKAVVAKTTSYLLGCYGATAGALLGSIIYSKIGTFVGGLIGGVVGTELAEQVIQFFYRLFY